MTRKLMLIAGAATMALTAPAMAGPKGGHGPSEQQHGGGKAQAHGGGGQARGGQQARPPKVQRAERAPQRQMQRAERAPQQRMQRAERAPQRKMQRAERAPQQRMQRVERQRPMKAERHVERQSRPAKIQKMERQHSGKAVQDMRRVERQRDLRSFDRKVDQRRDAFADRRYDGRADMRRLPASSNFGQEVAARAHLRNALRKEAHDEWKVGQRMDRQWAEQANWMPLGYADRYRDTPDWMYRYDGDQIYRVNRSTGIVGDIIPLLGGAYSIGQPMPGYYSSSYVPLGYRGLYYDTPDAYYRYGDGGLYQVNPSNGLITSLVALLAGTNLGIGQMLPTTYNTYNVPYAYRSQYYDTPDAWYRYNNGYIYQVDPTSRLIQSSYPIYGNGYYDVGQAWPTAYPSYNVPNYYQSTYYDTPQWDYRYANGAIYQVNPQNQLINALVSLVTGQQLNVGQMMPAGYGVYNVPLQYRSQYYDTADNWYRYGDGNIYRVDPYSGQIAEVIPTYA